MKRIILTSLIVAFAISVEAQDLTATIAQEAYICANTIIAGDYENFIKYTHKRIVALMGGKEAMIDFLKRGNEQMQSNGYGFIEATVGTPEEPKKIGSWLTSIVPEHIVMKVSGGKLHQDSVLLGISEDDGKSWVFVDLGPVTKERFAEVFPELDGQISLPDKKLPVFEKE